MIFTKSKAHPLKLHSIWSLKRRDEEVRPSESGWGGGGGEFCLACMRVCIRVAGCISSCLSVFIDYSQMEDMHE